MTLADDLARPDYAKTKHARVTMTLFVDNGRGGPFYGFSILTTKPITQLVHSSTRYTHVIKSGHDLAAQGTRNRIDITAVNKNQLIQQNQVSFDLILDGTTLTDDEGNAWIFAIRAAGRPVFLSPGEPFHDPVIPPNNFQNYRGIRQDLHQGNETDVQAGIYPAGDRFLHSWARDIDITLVDAPAAPRLRPAAVAKRGHFN